MTQVNRKQKQCGLCGLPRIAQRHHKKYVQSYHVFEPDENGAREDAVDQSNREYAHQLAREVATEAVPCETCGEPTPSLATKRCDACWDIESHLPSFLRKSAKAREFVATALADALLLVSA